MCEQELSTLILTKHTMIDMFLLPNLIFLGMSIEREGLREIDRQNKPTDREEREIKPHPCRRLVRLSVPLHRLPHRRDV